MFFLYSMRVQMNGNLHWMDLNGLTIVGESATRRTANRKNATIVVCCFLLATRDRKIIMINYYNYPTAIGSLRFLFRICHLDAISRYNFATMYSEQTLLPPFTPIRLAAAYNLNGFPLHGKQWRTGSLNGNSM